MSIGGEDRAVEPPADVGEFDTVSPSDACGCAHQPAARAAPANVVDAEEGQSPETQLAPTTPDSDLPEPPVRTVKLVALLRRTDDGYRAQLAVGTDGCDPVMRVMEVSDVSSALVALEAVLAEGEVRWQAQPRYPSAPRTPQPQRPPSPTRQAPALPPSIPPGSAPAATLSPTAASVQSSGDQLSLFG